MYYYDIVFMKREMVEIILKEQDIIKLDLDELHICKENPRTKIVIDEIQAIHEIIFEQGDKIIGLIKTLIEDGWIIGDLPAVYYENNEYTVYEGNRRISSLKCFFNPNLLPAKNKTSDKFKKYIATFSEDEVKKLRLEFQQIPVTLHKSKEILYKYMEKRHTPNNGKGDTLERWNTISNERFKNEILGKKTLIYAIYNEFIDLFKNIDTEQFPMSTLERILKNPNTKEKLKYNFKNDILIVEDKGLFEKYLKTIIDDIDKKKIDSRKLSKAEKIVKYIDEFTKDEQTKPIQLEHNYEKEKSNIENLPEEQLKIKYETKDKNEDDYKEFIHDEDDIKGSKRTKINIPKGLLFSYIEAKNVDANNPNNFGVLYLVDELKKLSKSGEYKIYPIATTMLVRNLLEQSLKYQLMKLGKWEIFVNQEHIKNKNNKEPGLESIINYCNGNTNEIFINDTKTQKTFRSFACNIGTKDYFDMLVHHPESINADYSILEKIAKAGLYRIIYNILNT